MSVLKPRNRLVNFRLTEEEFEQLRQACGDQGARSLSDFARSAVMRQVDLPGHGGSAALGNLGQVVDQLENRLQQMVNLLHGVGAKPSPSEAHAETHLSA